MKRIEGQGFVVSEPTGNQYVNKVVYRHGFRSDVVDILTSTFEKGVERGFVVYGENQDGTLVFNRAYDITDGLVTTRTGVDWSNLLDGNIELAENLIALGSTGVVPPGRPSRKIISQKFSGLEPYRETIPLAAKIIPFVRTKASNTHLHDIVHDIPGFLSLTKFIRDENEYQCFAGCHPECRGAEGVRALQNYFLEQGTLTPQITVVSYPSGSEPICHSNEILKGNENPTVPVGNLGIFIPPYLHSAETPLYYLHGFREPMKPENYDKVIELVESGDTEAAIQLSGELLTEAWDLHYSAIWD